MKILMIGLGSIGQRHLRNIKAQFGDQAEILAYRVRGLQQTFSDTMQIRENCLLEEEFGIHRFSDIDQALAEGPEVAYITNITSQHIPCAMKAVQAGCHVFLEKPVSDSLSGVSELLNAAECAGKTVFVGFQNRYHPCIRRMKEFVASGRLGKIITVQAEVGERLTTMHSYEDYRGTYMARRDQGGGVLMNQQIHELDYLQWIFGIPAKVISFNGKNSSLPIDVDDYCDSIYWVEGTAHSFPIYVHADFFQSPPSRFCKVIGESGWALADLIHAVFKTSIGDEVRQEAFPDFQRNHMFIDEMNDFFTSVQTGKQDMLSLEDGIVSLKMACAAKKSSAEGRIVFMDEVCL